MATFFEIVVGGKDSLWMEWDSEGATVGTRGVAKEVFNRGAGLSELGGQRYSVSHGVAICAALSQQFRKVSRLC